MCSVLPPALPWSLLLICALRPAGAVAVPSPALFAGQLPEMARERKEHCCCPAEPEMGVQPLHPLLPLRGRPDLLDWSCVGKSSLGVGRRCVMGRCKQQEFGINKTLGLSALFQALSLESCVFTCEFSTLCFISGIVLIPNQHLTAAIHGAVCPAVGCGS